MNVYQDIKKIIDQIRGKRNMFEYQTTLANQAYLLYSLLGKIYTTDKIHRHTKASILFIFVAMVILTIAEAVFYIIFYIHENLLTQMYAFFTIFAACYVVILALITHVYRHRIESTIRMVDKLVAKSPIDSYIRDEQINVKILLMVFVFYLSSLVPFLLGCVIDVAIFYDESKVKSNIYYLVPLPKLEQYGSLGLYLVFNTTAAMAACAGVFATLATLVLPLMWIIACHNEVQRIVRDMSSLSENLHMTAVSDVYFERQFKTTIIRCVHAYRDVIRTVGYFQGYYETIANILFPFILYMDVVHAHILMTTDYSFNAKLKEFSILFALLQLVYAYCWVGEILTEMTNTMSFAVYSTPWYMSTKVRKDAYIFLCQTQKSINPAAWSVYPLSLATFLRFMNVIQSSVNILRAVSTK